MKLPRLVSRVEIMMKGAAPEGDLVNSSDKSAPSDQLVAVNVTDTQWVDVPMPKIEEGRRVEAPPQTRPDQLGLEEEVKHLLAALVTA